MEYKTCKRCHERKPVTEFEKYRLYCKTCKNIDDKKRQSAYKEYLINYRRENSAHIVKKATKWNREHPEQRRKTALGHYYRLQDEAIMAYGGYKCACCGETEPLFLTLDHINNDGNAHRKYIRWTGAGLYRWLKRNGYPPIVQVLCMNCNFAKRRNQGICPHKGLSS